MLIVGILVLLAAAVGFGLAMLLPRTEPDPNLPHPTLVATSTIPPPKP